MPPVYFHTVQSNNSSEIPLSHLFERVLHLNDKEAKLCFIVLMYSQESEWSFVSSQRAWGQVRGLQRGQSVEEMLSDSLQYPSLFVPLSLKQGAIVSDPGFLLLLLNGCAMLKTKACVCLPKVSVFKLPLNGFPVFTLQWTEVYQSCRKLVCLEGVMANITFSHNRVINVTITLGKQVIMLSL